MQPRGISHNGMRRAGDPSLRLKSGSVQDDVTRRTFGLSHDPFRIGLNSHPDRCDAAHSARSLVQLYTVRV